MGHNDIQDRVAQAVELAELPYILFPGDLALHLRLDPDEARAAIRQGLLGPWLLVHGEPVVLRDHLKEHLRLRMVQRRDADREVFPSGRPEDLHLVEGEDVPGDDGRKMR